MEYDYTEYWNGEFEKREKARYFDNLYGNIKHKLLPKKGTVLDVGGGNGHLLYYLGIKNATVMDISDSGLKFAKDKFGFNTVNADILKKFPFKDKSFDIIYCCEVLEHLADSRATLDEMFRVLKREGFLIISVPNMKPDGVHHKHQFKINELRDLLKDENLVIEEVFFKTGFRGGYSFKSIFESGAGLAIKRIIANIISWIPKSFKIFLSEKYPDRFSYFFVVITKKK